MELSIQFLENNNYSFDIALLCWLILTVLNFFNEFWDLVYIEFFSISLLVALLLQLLLQVTIKVEHYVASHFKKMDGRKAKILRVLATWGVLFGSSVVFGGPVHGVVAFIVVVVAIIIAEQTFAWIHRSLA